MIIQVAQKCPKNMTILSSLEDKVFNHVHVIYGNKSKKITSKIILSQEWRSYLLIFISKPINQTNKVVHIWYAPVQKACAWYGTGTYTEYQ